MIRILLVLFAMISFSACQKAIPLKAIKVAPARVETTISTTTTGTVEADQAAVLSFGAIGRIDRIAIKAGQSVRKGQLLAKLENRDVSSIVDNASKELSRAHELFKENLVSRANLDEAEKAFQVARANLDKTEIRAPFDGVITEMNLQVGELSQTTFSPDKPPLRLVDQKPRIIEGNIDEVDLAKVRVGSQARIKVPAAGSKPFFAEIFRVVPYVSTTKEQERTAKIELKVIDKEAERKIPVGASAEIEVIVEARDNVPAIPSRAVLGAASQRYVYRVEDDRLRKTFVKTGIGNYDRTEIAEGIVIGDVIVLPGDTELKDGLKAKIELQTWP